MRTFSTRKIELHRIATEQMKSYVFYFSVSFLLIACATGYAQSDFFCESLRPRRPKNGNDETRCNGTRGKHSARDHRVGTNSISKKIKTCSPTSGTLHAFSPLSPSRSADVSRSADAVEGMLSVNLRQPAVLKCDSMRVLLFFSRRCIRRAEWQRLQRPSSDGSQLLTEHDALCLRRRT